VGTPTRVYAPAVSSHNYFANRDREGNILYRPPHLNGYQC